MDFGFLKIAAATPGVKAGDCSHNIARIAGLIREADRQGVSVAAFPELCITGYTCGDLFGQPFLIEQAERALARLLADTASCRTVCIAGMPLAVDNRLYNTAVVFGSGIIFGVVPKTYLPNYDEFYEARWFASGAEPHRETVELCGQQVPFSTDLLFEDGKVCFGVEICEDLWVPHPPSSRLAVAGATLLVNLSASDEMVGKHAYLRSLIAQQSARTLSAYLYSSAGFGESSTDVVFAGNGLIAENGIFLNESERFSLEEQLTVAETDIERLLTLRRKTNTFASYGSGTLCKRIPVALRADREQFPVERGFNPSPFIPDDPQQMQQRCEEIFSIQVGGLAQRIRHTGTHSAVVGISGGLDSTLALLVAVRTFDKLGLPRRNILGVTMPGFGTTDRTHTNALRLMESLGVGIREISIREACAVHFRDIGMDDADRSVAYENAQARERTQILMDLANRTGGLVIGTGDLSELALGWATYNGDHMSMYGVNCGVPKTLVRHLVRWVAAHPDYEVARGWLLDIVDTPISPELLPADEKGEIVPKDRRPGRPLRTARLFSVPFRPVRLPARPNSISWPAGRSPENTTRKPSKSG